ncbi:hypothetical protein [Muricomes intestini]|jgi:uncharacterized protein YjcR
MEKKNAMSGEEFEKLSPEEQIKELESLLNSLTEDEAKIVYEEVKRISKE